MIEVLRGSEARLLHACLARERGGALWLCAAGRELRAWAGVRGLVAQLVRRLGADAVEDAFRRHPVTAGFALPHVRARLSAGEQESRASLGARLASHLSHNFFIQGPLFVAWGALLGELLAAAREDLIVPSLCRLDTPSLAAFKALVFDHVDTLSGLTLGWVTDPPERERDEWGLAWHYPAGDLDALALGVEGLPGARRVELGGAGATDEAWPVIDDVSVLGPAFDHEAWASIDAHAALPRPAALVGALRHAFAGFGFSAALRLGLALERGGPALSGREAADAHGIVALCAHNRQFASGGNRALAGFIERHLTAALAAETRPAERCALLYRLAVTHGRRLGDLETGVGWIERALAACDDRGLTPKEAAYQRAWALNFRSYLRMRQGAVADAAREAQDALETLLSTPEPAAGSCAWRERTVTRAVLASNLATLAHVSGSNVAYARWRRGVAAVTRATPGMSLFRSLDLVALHRRALQPALALDYAHEGLEAARGAHDATWEHTYLRDVADLRSSLGDAAGACDAWDDARRLRARLGSRAAVPAVDVPLGLALRRAGRPDEARTCLEQAAATDRPAVERAEALAALGLIAAEGGDAEAAERHVNAAVTLAVESGARPALVRVALAAGRASLCLGRAAAARDAFQRALALAAGAHATSFAFERFAARLGLAEAAAHDPQAGARACAEAVEQALELLPRALDEGETWWLLEPLAARAATLPGERLRAHAALPSLLAALTRRPDGAAGLRALRTALGDAAFGAALGAAGDERT